MASEYLRVGQGREKVTQDQLDNFLEKNNLSSLDDLPLCKICGRRHVHFRVKENTIFDTCGPDGKCSASERQTLVAFRGYTRYSKEQISEFCEYFGLKSLEDRTRCSCGVKVYISIPNKIMGSTCGKEGLPS